jgi:cytidyltransferase-like protein
MNSVVVMGSFDNLRSHHVRFLQEAARLGDRLHVLLWSDEMAGALEGQAPRFPEGERLYLLNAIRYVDEVTLVAGRDDPMTQVAAISPLPAVWAVPEESADDAQCAFCAARGLQYRSLGPADLAGFPLPAADQLASAESARSGRRKAIVTGCYDWLHSGHVRFFEEVSALGDLYVIVGNDANVRFLKGEGHPLFGQDERRYMAGSIRYVHQALITSGWGWMDAAPEIERLRPDIYAVNQDGDKPEKRIFCEEHGLDYVVLKRTPKEGLPRRESTTLRGF